MTKINVSPKYKLFDTLLVLISCISIFVNPKVVSVTFSKFYNFIFMNYGHISTQMGEKPGLMTSLAKTVKAV